MSKVIYFIFIILLFLVIFEGGFLWWNFINDTNSSQKTQINSETGQKSQTSQPVNLNLYNVLNNDNFINISGQPVSSVPSINSKFLISVIRPIKSADKGLLTVSTISYTFRGKLVELNTNGIGNKGAKDLFFLSLENEKTGTVVRIDREPNEIIAKIRFLSDLDPQKKHQPISINEFKIGDIVEETNTVDLLTEQIMTRDIILLSRGK
jgi:hypothetical protein